MRLEKKCHYNPHILLSVLGLQADVCLLFQDMEHVAGVLKELRTDAAGLARGAGGPGGAAGEAGEGDAVSALQREIAELAGSVGDTAAHADGEGGGGTIRRVVSTSQDNMSTP